MIRPPELLLTATAIRLAGDGDSERVKNTSFNLPKGVTAITGPTGAGKTSLAVVLHGLLRPTAGEVRHVGINPDDPYVNTPDRRKSAWRTVVDPFLLETPAERKTKAYRAKSLGYIAQNPHLNPGLTGMENIVLPHIARGNQINTGYLMHLAGLLDIVEPLNRYPRSLSGGERQRVAILSALVHKPELVTADEPTSALDVAHGEDTFAMMREISQTEGTSFLIVTHNEHVKDYVDNNIHMIDGQVVETTLPTGPIDVDFLRHK